MTEPQTAAVWLISLVSIASVMIRPKGLPEALWAVLGAGLLLVFRLISPNNAVKAVGTGTDVYLFLAGMMIIAELARREGVFEWLAVHAVKAAKGSRSRLFALVYGVGILVTVFLSNDATAVVLTPAVLAAVQTAGADPLPYLFICAFIANAASFVLPISNPANLVVYGKGLPPLGRWFLIFGLPCLLSIVVTFLALRLLSRKQLEGSITNPLCRKWLSPSGKLTLGGIGVLAATVIATSAWGRPLGAPTFIAGVFVAGIVTVRDRYVARDLIKEISWSVIPLVAGLFVIVEALNRAGALQLFTTALRHMRSWPPLLSTLSSSFGIAIISNLMNNLPSGLMAGSAVAVAGTTGPLRDAIMIGVDLGPNLSITGSLATILWLIAIRRDGQRVSFWQFLRWGVIVMPPALLCAVLALLIAPQQ